MMRVNILRKTDARTSLCSIACQDKKGKKQDHVLIFLFFLIVILWNVKIRFGIYGLASDIFKENKK